MKLIYTAGPIRDKRGAWYVQQNYEMARDVARKIWLMGHGVICPHMNNLWMDGHDMDHHVFMAGDLEMVKRVDALVMLPGWCMSEGAQEEYVLAKSLGKQIFIWPSNESIIRSYGRDGKKEVQERRSNAS